jgi:hypothetical protein
MTDNRELWQAIHDLKRRLDERERRERVGAWVDYSATSTITGWSAYTTQHIYYTRENSLVYVVFNLIGTSNSTEAKFTLPYTSAANPNIRFLFRAQDNGGAFAPAIGYLSPSSNLVTTGQNIAGSVWTNSGDKTIQGQFFYSV